MDMKKEPNRRVRPPNVDDSPLRDSSADDEALSSAAIRMVHTATATTVTATGLLVLVGGWGLEFEPLKGIFPGFPTMKVNTAIGFILCGLSLWLRGRPTPKAHRAAGILGLLVALLGTASLAQYLSGINLGIDELFFRDTSSAFTSHPGRMSSNTALSFILMGCSLVALPSAAAVWLALASLMPVLLSIAGYIYGATAFVGLLSLTGMAFHTITSFLFLVVGVLTTRPMRGLAIWLLSLGPEGTVLRCMMPAAVFVVVGTALVTQRGFSAGIYTEQSRDALNLFASLVALCGLTLVIARIVARVDFERKQAETITLRQNIVLDRINGIFETALSPCAKGELGKACLAIAEEVTGSRFGFIAEIGKDGLLHQIAISDPDKTFCTMYGEAGNGHLPGDFHIHGIYGRVLLDGKGLFTNEPHSHPDSIGTPERHPLLTSFLGVPMLHGERTVGIIAVANREGGYSRNELEVLEALAPAMAEGFLRKRAEDTLRENELFYRQTLDSIPGMVFTTRPDGYCDYQSQRWVDFTGIPMSEHLGDGWNRLLHPDDRPLAFAAWRAAVEERAPYDLQYRVRRYDGVYKWFKVRGRPIRNESGEIVRWFGAALDIDDLVEAQDALQASEEKLRRTNEELEQRVADRTKELARTVETLREEIEERRRAQDQLLQSQKMETVGRLAGGIAHDFNNLLMVMSGFAEQAQESSEDPVAKESLQHVITAGSKAKELTHKLLTFSRQHIMQKRRINLGAVVDEMLRLLKRLIGENIEVRLSVASDTMTVDADQGQIEQVLTNIVLNARDSMPAGGTLNLSVCRERVKEATAIGLEKGEYAVIEIRDTGVGISPGDLDRIFDPFFSTKETGKGTGLGLSIAYGIVKQHAGAITVQSSPGNGSTFKIFLPLVEEMPETMPVSVAAAVQGGSETLLLVEDDPTVRLYLRKILERGGYAVIEAVDGEEALRLAEENAFSLLVSDMLMPKMNGSELYAALKEKKPDMHCVLISGYSSDILQETLPPDMVFVQKPVTKEDLLQTVATALSRRDPA